MKKNYYDVDVQLPNGLFKTIVKQISHIDGSKKVLAERANGNVAKLCYGFHEYRIMSQNEIDFKEGVEVTKENIYLYYEFMSEDDLKKLNWGAFYDIKNHIGIFQNRYSQVGNSLNIAFGKLANFSKYIYRDFKLPKFPEQGYDDYLKKSYSFNTPIGLEVFGVKDTLKPINEYIADIKVSKGYRAFLYTQNG